ncbi:MAG: hypothetical protein QXF58_05090 [Desulfurococcaceae archaeon]
MERTGRLDVIAGGISVGGDGTTAGTLSGIFYDTETGKYVLVSNAHVFEGKYVLQPGIYDGGKSNDVIGVITKRSEFKKEPNAFVRFIYYILAHLGIEVAGAYNYLDCAAACISLADETRRIERGVYMDDGRIVRITGKNRGDGVIGKKVWKVGRTTGYTEGVIVSDSAVVEVWYGDETYLFKDVIIVKGRSEPGDSGSPVFIMRGNEPSEEDEFVGLLFAGSSNYFIVCKNKYLEDIMGLIPG